MKMNKILAAGVAATLAVTSLASVASATTERSYNMESSVGTGTYSPKLKSGASGTIQVSGQFDSDNVTGKPIGTFGSATNLKDVTTVDTNGDGIVGSYLDFDYYIPIKITGTNADKIKAGGMTVTITGTKQDSRGIVSISRTTTLASCKSLDGSTTDVYYLPLYFGESEVGKVMINEFATVDTIAINTGASSYTVTLATEAEYNAFKTDGSVVAAGTAVIKADRFRKVSTATWNDAKTELTLTGTIDDAETDDILLQKIVDLINGEKVRGTGEGITYQWAQSGKSLSTTPAWLPHTNIDDNGILWREEIKELSTTKAHASSSWASGGNDYNQTYDQNTTYNYNEGTGPRGFAGLASQVADFFNKQTNGTITFYFDTPAAENASSDWVNGGIPSTEVGVKTLLQNSTSKDFALFVNYGSTTGSLQALATIKASEGAVQFDISDILKALGGQTIGVIQDLYYGLDGGLVYKDANGKLTEKGLWVKKVTLAYEESAAVAADTAKADDKDAEVAAEPEKVDEPKNNDKADTVEIPDEPDDDDNTVVIDEPAEQDTTVDNTAESTTPVVIDTPATVAADENPHTGAALAVIPAVVAAAAMALTKKRK